jgi:hypothetical protein
MKGNTMAKTDEIPQDQLDDFTSAWAEEAGGDQPAGDDGFGLMPGEEVPQPAAKDEPAAVVVAVVEPEGAAPTTTAGEAAANASAQQQADAVTDAANAAAADSGTPATAGEKEAAAQSGTDKDKPAAGAAEDDDPLAGVPPEDMQKAKSWMGRLKKMEADLMRERAELDATKKGQAAAPAQAAADDKSAAASDQLEQVAQQAGEGGNTQMADAVQQAAEQVEAGKITPEEARARLAADFGDEFTTLLGALVKGAAPNQGASSEDVEQIKRELQRRHFEDIHDAHPDFMDIHKSPEFQAYLAANPEAAQVAQGGTARQINKMLDTYKKSRPAPAAQAPASTAATAPAAPAAAAAPAQDPVDQAAADAAGAVKSRGVRLPERPAPAADDDYEAAFNAF